MKRQFDEAARHLQTAIQEQPGSPFSHRYLAACYAHMGRLSEARDLVERLRAMAAVIPPNPLPFRKPEDCQLFLSGLRLAMGEIQ